MHVAAAGGLRTQRGFRRRHPDTSGSGATVNSWRCLRAAQGWGGCRDASRSIGARAAISGVSAGGVARYARCSAANVRAGRVAVRTRRHRSLRSALQDCKWRRCRVCIAPAGPEDAATRAGRRFDMERCSLHVQGLHAGDGSRSAADRSIQASNWTNGSLSVIHYRAIPASGAQEAPSHCRGIPVAGPPPWEYTATASLREFEAARHARRHE